MKFIDWIATTAVGLALCQVVWTQADEGGARPESRLTILGGTSPPDTKTGHLTVALADPAAAAQKPTAANPLAAAVPGYESGLEYRYYEGAWEAMPEAIVAVPFKTGTAAQFDLAAADRKVGYAFDFRGRLRIDREGEYTFYTTSDAGSRLKVVGKTVVDNDCSHIPFGFPSPHEAKGTIALKPGLQPVHLIFYTDRFTPEPFLRVEYAGPGIARQVVPAEVLYHPAPVPRVAPPAAPQPLRGPSAMLNLVLRKQMPAKDAKGLFFWRVVETPVQWRADETMFIIILSSKKRERRMASVSRCNRSGTSCRPGAFGMSLSREPPPTCASWASHWASATWSTTASRWSWRAT